MIRKLLAVSATSLMLLAGSQSAPAKTLAPEAFKQAPISTSEADGRYRVANAKNRDRHRRRKHRRGNSRRNLEIGLGLAAGVIALGAAAAAAREREEYGACRRVERRCARRHGWETRRWYYCVEDRGC